MAIDESSSSLYVENINDNEDDNMKIIRLTPDDAAQVKALILSFAELSDQNAMSSEVILGRIRHDCPDQPDMIDALEEQISDFNEDSDNLKRIALMFT